MHRRNLYGLKVSLLVILSLAMVITPMSAQGVGQTFTVTNTNDSGAGSLRQAIEDANDNGNAPDVDMIAFNIPGAGPHTINLTSALPGVGSFVDINGTTEPDFAGTPVIELNGTNAGATANGLSIGGSNVTVRGLVINRFGRAGIFSTGNDNVIEGNFIGTDVTGTADLGNGGDGVFLAVTLNNRIGGTTAAARNVIAGNGQNGIEIFEDADNNVVQGNFIGTNAAGTAAVRNDRDGVRIDEDSDTNTIGGMTAGARNVISGNGIDGIRIVDGSEQNIVQGNFIGTNAAGTAALPNFRNGVEIHQDCDNNTIGGTTVEARNVISGNNNEFGVRIYDGSDQNVVQGNFIGTNASGTAALFNGSGVVIGDSAQGTVVGGATAAPGTPPGNVISGNAGSGVLIAGGFDSQVQGNLIGTDATGTVGIGNGFGVTLAESANNTIGGTTPTARNVISGNNRNGVLMTTVEGGGATGNLVQNNFIGTDITGVADIGNLGAGVFITENSSANVVTENTIAFNGSATSDTGVVISSTSGVGNALLSNSIFSNADLGINLEGGVEDANGVTENDAGDGDREGEGEGANNLQNFPVLTSAISGNSTTIQGTLNSTANTTFRIEFFSNTVCDPSDFGEGQTFIGFTNVTTVGNDATINVTLPTTVPVGQFITATATAPNGSTSEFSRCIQVTSVATANLSVTKSDTPDPVTLGNNLTYTITVTNNGNATATDVDLMDFLPNGVEVVSETGSQGNYIGTAGGVVNADLGNINAGAFATVTIIVRVNVTGTLTNIVNVTADGIQSVTAMATTTAIAPDLTGMWGNLTQTSTGGDGRVIFYGGSFGSAGQATNTLTGTFTVEEVENVDAPPFIVRFFLSDDTTLNGGAPAARVISGRNTPRHRQSSQQDLLLAEVTVDSLGGEDTRRIDLNVTLPHSVSAVGKFVIAVVDATGAVAESNEGNNVIVSGAVGQAAQSQRVKKPTKATKQKR